jgi:hypothetical protein
VLLVFVGAVADFAEAMDEDSPREAVACLALVGLVVTEVSKEPIWKAFCINELRHGVGSKLLIL